MTAGSSPVGSANPPLPEARGRSRPSALQLVVVIVIVLAVLFAGLFALGILPGSKSGPSTPSGPPTYTVTFTETGLPKGTDWSIELTNHSANEITNASSVTDSIVVSEPTGTYRYSIAMVDVAPVGDFVASPSSGTFTVNNAPQTVTTAFAGPLIGREMTWLPPQNETGSTIVGCPTASGHYCYSIAFAGVSPFVNTSTMELSLWNAEKATVPWPVGITISLVTVNSPAANATYNTATEAWTLTPPYNGMFHTNDAIVLFTAGTGAGQGLLDLNLLADGVDYLSGYLVSASFP